MENISIVIPVYNEEENVLKLAAEINQAFSEQDYAWEVIWVNDVSTDRTKFVLEQFISHNSQHRLVNLKHQSGQSAAVLIGIHSSQYNLIATLDGDGQNAPSDLVNLKILLEKHDLWLAQGVRVKRRDSGIRKLSTKIANAVRNFVLGIQLNDVGCAVRVFRKRALIGMPAFKGWHRFLPVMIALSAEDKIRELPVQHRPRLAGISKYGIMNRLWVGIYDIFGILWFKNRGVSIQKAIAYE